MATPRANLGTCHQLGLNQPASPNCHLASQGLSNPGIATCMPKIHIAKQRIWHTTMRIFNHNQIKLLILFGDSMSVAKSSIGMPLSVLHSPNTEFSITAS